MSIRKKLSLAFSMVFLAIIIMGSVLWWSLEELSWARQRLDTSNSYSLTATTLNNYISRQMKIFTDILLIGKVEDEEKFSQLKFTILKTFDDWSSVVQGELIILRKKSSEKEIQEEEEELEKIARMKKFYIKLSEDMSRLKILANKDRQGEELKKTLEGIEDKFENTLFLFFSEALVQGNMEIQRSLAKANKISGSVKLITIAVIGLTLILIVIIIFFIEKILTNPINLMKDAAIQIGRGNYQTKISVYSKDEIGLLASTFETMAKQVKIRTQFGE